MLQHQLMLTVVGVHQVFAAATTATQAGIGQVGAQLRREDENGGLHGGAHQVVQSKHPVGLDGVEAQHRVDRILQKRRRNIYRK